MAMIPDTTDCVDEDPPSTPPPGYAEILDQCNLSFSTGLSNPNNPYLASFSIELPDSNNSYNAGYDQSQDHIIQRQPQASDVSVVTTSTNSSNQRQSVVLLLLSIFTCMCCFWPTGIVAIVYAIQVITAAGAGDGEKVRRKELCAHMWIIVTVVLGLGIAVVLVAISQ